MSNRGGGGGGGTRANWFIAPTLSLLLSISSRMKISRSCTVANTAASELALSLCTKLCSSTKIQLSPFFSHHNFQRIQPYPFYTFNLKKKNLSNFFFFCFLGCGYFLYCSCQLEDWKRPPAPLHQPEGGLTKDALTQLNRRRRLKRCLPKTISSQKFEKWS